MIILDTHVVSEPMRSAPDPKVLAWLDAQIAEDLFITSTSLAELLFGVELLAGGRRKQGLEIALSQLMARLFDRRILAFDAEAATHFAMCCARARNGGTPISVADGQIAAIASSRGMSVATRVVKPFAAANIPFVNPWQ